MRIVYHGFNDGTYHIFRTEDDGSGRRTLEGGPPNGIKRIIAFIEVSCDDTQEGLEKLKSGLANLSGRMQSEEATVIL